MINEQIDEPMLNNFKNVAIDLAQTSGAVIKKYFRANVAVDIKDASACFG